MTRWLLCGAVALWGAACGSPSGNDGGNTSAACQGVAARTLDAVFPRYFAQGVATSCLQAGCHQAGSGGLTFDSAATFHAATVGKPSASDASKTLVKPGDPDQSWLFAKLLDTAPSQMPVGGPYLDAAGLAEVKGWICAGAQPPSGGGGGAPTVTQLAPTSGLVGTTVVVTGTNFGATPSANQVAFNGTAALVFSASRTQLTVAVPPGAATGPVSVTVAGATGTSAQPFTVTAGNPIPVVRALSPCGKVAGQGAFTLTVDGQNFSAGMTTLTFAGTAVPVTVASATQLTAAVPAGLVASAPAGNVAAVVLTNAGPGGGASPPADFGLAGASSTLAAQVQPIFTSNCATAGCHNAAAQAAGLNLSAGASAAELIDVPSLDCAPKLRVRACSPTRAGSVLIDKLLATAVSPPCSGTAMPKGAPLTAQEKQRIVDWVAQGAP